MARTQRLVETVPLVPLVPLAVSIQAHMTRLIKITMGESLSVSSIRARVLMTCRVLNVNGLTTPPFYPCKSNGGTLPPRLLVMVLLH
jgi:hypothetical protein